MKEIKKLKKIIKGKKKKIVKKRRSSKKKKKQSVSAQFYNSFDFCHYFDYLFFCAREKESY